MNMYKLKLECEHSNCPARYTYELEIYGQDFRMCTHHARKVVREINPDMTDKEMSTFW